MEKRMERNIEVFVAPIATTVHPYWSGPPKSIGWFSEEEIEAGKEKEYGGNGTYSYSSPLG